MARTRVGIAECFGLLPLDVRLREALVTLRGDATTPKTVFDTTSLRVLQPRLSLPLWLGINPFGRRIPIYNFFSHARPPLELGWSVRVTQARDFRGLAATYDSHNGTDFAIPPGTTVVAAAPGRVLRISSEFNRGGLKVFVDHGGGLMTSYNHLSRTLARVGQDVGRGEAIALSGMSGIDGLLLFPLSTPHVHFNVWLNGDYVDPFAREGEVSLWRTPNAPTPHEGAVGSGDEGWAPTAWDAEAVEQVLSACVHEGAREDIASRTEPGERAMAAHFQQAYFPTRFRRLTVLTGDRGERAPRLDLPFSRDDFDGVVFPSEARSRVPAG